jgi:hypothetical protein
VVLASIIILTSGHNMKQALYAILSFIVAALSIFLISISEWGFATKLLFDFIIGFIGLVFILISILYDESGSGGNGGGWHYDRW